MKKYAKYARLDSLVNQWKQSPNDQTFDEIAAIMRPLLKTLEAIYWLRSCEKSDVENELLYGLWIALRDFRIRRKSAINFFDFAKLVIKRHFITKICFYSSKQRNFDSSMLPFMAKIDKESDDENKDYLACFEIDNTLHRDQFETLLHREKLNDIHMFLYDRLTAKEKPIFDLYLTGYRYSEMSAMTGRDYKSCENALCRIRQKAKQMMQEMPALFAND